ncbi:MAG: ABC transporter permease [Clostridiales bacterium]|jgi:ABC-type antimicrobial peptide transport system permease subunit|nr:ABC transporter permease [Clostridiales bacterium]MDR2749443.1 ABC transporter permease [Clostridiales bacterium]
MSSIDIITMALRNLFKRKMRTVLTVLGVVIATASIVVMISLGLAMNAKFDAEVEGLGDVTTVTIYGNVGVQVASVSANGGGRVQQNQPPPLDDNAIASFRRLKGVKAATGLLRMNLHFKSGKYILSWANVMALDPASMAELGYKAAQGRLLEPGDKLNVVFGAKAELNFYKEGVYDSRFYQDMMGEEVQTYVDVFKDKITMSTNYNFLYPNDAEVAVKPETIHVAGLLEPKDMDTDQSIFMEISTAQKLKKTQQKEEQEQNAEYGYFSSSQQNRTQQQALTYDTALVKCTDLDTVKKVKDELTDMGFYAQIPTQYLDSLQSFSQGIQTLLGAIGAVSIFVAAIGIANTMVMAIYERTKEIGVMKVIGASIKDIKKLFLLEAALIGLIGGVFGLGLSFVISYALNHVRFSFFSVINEMFSSDDHTISLITPWLCGMALVFAAVVGLLSGYFPARRAMKLSALAAIRSE